MQTITISMPDDFSEEQIDFIRRSAQLQIEAEIRKDLVVPQETIDLVEMKIDEVETANIIEERKGVYEL